MKILIFIPIILLIEFKRVSCKGIEFSLSSKIDYQKQALLKKWLLERKNNSYFNCDLIEKRSGLHKKITLFISKGFLYITMKYDKIQNNYPLLNLTTLEQPEFFTMPKTFPPTTSKSIFVKAYLIDSNDRLYRVTHTLSSHEEIKTDSEYKLDQRIYEISLKRGVISYESTEYGLKNDWPY